MWYDANRCDECAIKTSSKNEIENDRNQEIVNEGEVERRENKVRKVRTRRRQRWSEI